jgi:chromatin segregation and condensation protein Rec8/ScpA/Scc1 (kleisin family)
MAYSPTEEAIALLIDLAERGEINPWDVQVIDVIDRFLARMAPTASSHDLSSISRRWRCRSRKTKKVRRPTRCRWRRIPG